MNSGLPELPNTINVYFYQSRRDNDNIGWSQILYGNVHAQLFRGPPGSNSILLSAVFPFPRGAGKVEETHQEYVRLHLHLKAMVRESERLGV